MKDDGGSVSLLVLSAAAVLCVFMVMITECCYVVTVRERISAASETALDSAVEYAVRDGYRRDEKLRIDTERASYLFGDEMIELLELDGNGWHRDSKGRPLWRYEERGITAEENGLRVSAKVEIKPYLLSGGIFGNISFFVDVRTEAFINYNR